jgi:hypothetical protein
MLRIYYFESTLININISFYILTIRPMSVMPQEMNFVTGYYLRRVLLTQRIADGCIGNLLKI